MTFRELNAKCLAIKVEVETPPRAVAPGAVKGELVRQITVRFALVAIAEPVLARNGGIEQGGAQVDKRHVEAAPIKRHDTIVMSGYVPKSRQQFRLVRTGNEFHVLSIGGGIFFKIFGDEQDLASSRVVVEHGNADNPRRQRPKIEQLQKLLLPNRSLRLVRKLVGVPKEIFLLGIIERLERECRSFYIEDEFSHGGFYAPNLSNMRALACMRRMRNLASNTPSEPRFAPVSVKRSSLSVPEYADASKTGCGCQEWALSAHGVEWSPVMASTSGFFCKRIGKAASNSSMACFFASKLPSSPYISVYL